MTRLALRASAVAAVALSASLAAQDVKPEKAPRPRAVPAKIPGYDYRPNDMTRPRPVVIDPGTASTEAAAGRPPSDAVVLFDGKDLSEWTGGGKAPDNAAKWKVANGYFEIAPRTGSITTRKKFGDSQVHIEWATPSEVKGSGQGRGNSGVYLGAFGEVQVLDSYNNDTYPDGQAAGLYGRFPPLVNASRKPGEWQVYDILVRHAKTDEKGKVVRPAMLTVLHNGIFVHHAVEFDHRAKDFAINLQDHGNPVRFRNVWVRPVREYDENGTPPPAKK